VPDGKFGRMDNKFRRRGFKMIINNNIAGDNYTERAERLQLLSTNIDTYAVELAISGARLASAQNADAGWDNACAKCVVEAGQTDEAYEEFNKAVVAASKYYSASKGHLLTIIYEVGGKPDDYINRYGFNVDSPRKYKPTTRAIEAWKLEHDRLVALPDPRVISDAIMTKLWAHKTGIDGLSNVAFIEKLEADTAFDEKQALFDAQTNLLQFVLTAAVLTWGDEDPRLNLLGFKPKSEIWTPGTPEPGTPIHPEAATFVATYLGQKTIELVYGAVVGAVKGSIQRRKTGNMNWIIIAQGLPMDDLNRVPFRDTNVEPGEYEYEFVCYDDAQEPSVAAYSTVTVTEEVPG